MFSALPLGNSTRWFVFVGMMALGVLSASEEDFPDPLKIGASSGHYHVYVSNERSGDISIIDSKTLEVVRTVIAGKRPRGLKLSQDGQTLYVATSGSPVVDPEGDPQRTKNQAADETADGIAVIDLVAGKRVKQLKVGANPEELALSRDGLTVIVSNEDGAMASLWQVATGEKVAEVVVSKKPEGIVLHPVRDEVYVACEEAGEIHVLDSKDGRQIAKIALGGRPRALVFSKDGTRAYVPLETKPEIVIIDADKHAVIETVQVTAPGLPTGAAISPDGREVYVTTGRGGNSVLVLETKSREIVETIPVGTRPWGIAVTPDGTHLFTANGVSNDVSVVNVKSRREVARIPVAEGPWGVTIGPVIVP